MYGAPGLGEGAEYRRGFVLASWLASTSLLGYLSPAPRTGLVHADAWTVFRRPPQATDASDSEGTDASGSDSYFFS